MAKYLPDDFWGADTNNEYVGPTVIFRDAMNLGSDRARAGQRARPRLAGTASRRKERTLTVPSRAIRLDAFAIGKKRGGQADRLATPVPVFKRMTIDNSTLPRAGCAHAAGGSEEANRGNDP